MPYNFGLLVRILRGIVRVLHLRSSLCHLQRRTELKRALRASEIGSKAPTHPSEHFAQSQVLLSDLVFGLLGKVQSVVSPGQGAFVARESAAKPATDTAAHRVARTTRLAAKLQREKGGKKLTYRR